MTEQNGTDRYVELVVLVRNGEVELWSAGTPEDAVALQLEAFPEDAGAEEEQP